MTRKEAMKEIELRVTDIGNGYKAGFIPKEYLWVFSLGESNRDIDKTKSLKIKKTFEVTGTNINPISISSDGKVADGQNRLDAILKMESIEMGAHIQFVPFTIEEIMIILNTTQKNWSINDFFKSNASKGINSYEKGLELMAIHDVDLSTLMAFIPIGNTMVKEGKNFVMPTDIEDSLSYVIKIKEAEVGILGNHRRVSRWAAAMNIISNRVEEIRDIDPEGYMVKEWEKRGGFDKISKDLPKIIKASTSGDQVMTLAGILSKALDYGAKRKLKLVFIN